MVTLAAVSAPLILSGLAPWRSVPAGFDLPFAALWIVGIVCAIGAAYMAKFHRLAALMMMGGAGMMGGDSQAGAGGNSGQKTGQADVKSIAEALRRELVEAAADARGENVPIEDIRRKTEQGKSTLGFSRVVPLATFDHSRTTAPPAVPVARHPLLYNYFIRKQ